MKSKNFELSEMLKIWEAPPGCPAPIFPIVYMEIQKAEECRGFIRVEHLVGDVDIVGYPQRGDDIIIDSTGNMIKLGFDGFVVPQFLIKQLSIEELKENLMPSLTYTDDSELLSEIFNDLSVESIINIVANRFSW
jgi:hypothetical protein